MRNLKKLLAVIMTVALIASMMVPALAAGTYESEAAKLKEIGLFVGTSKTDGSTDFLLGSELYRDQAMILIIRALGEEKAALALTDAEVAATLANVVDADKIASWAKKYAAYALQEKITYGVGGVEAGKTKFGPGETIDGTDFTILLLRALGYSTVSKTTVLDVVVEAGVLSQIDAIAALSAKPYYRDFAAHTIFGAVKNGETADGKSFIETLIAAGAVDSAKAASAGFIAATPTTLEVVGVSATNLKEIVVTFNTTLDEDTAEDESNYDVESDDNADNTVATATLNADGKSVTLLLADGDELENQSNFEVTISNTVKSEAGIALATDVTKTGYVFDNTVPVPLSAEQVGPDSFDITFSEPVQVPLYDNIVVDNSAYSIDTITTGDNYYVLTVKVYGTLTTGAHKVKVSKVQDFAEYSNVVTTLDFTAVKDETPPVIVSVEKASPEEVILVFNEKIVLNGVDAAIAEDGDVYHTNSNNTPSSIEADGKKLTISFADHKLPNGSAYLYIAEGVVEDLWGNENAEIKNFALSVTVDVTKPTAKAESPDDKTINIIYSEKVDTTDMEVIVLDSTGAEVDDADYYFDTASSVTYTAITFYDSLSGSTYSVVVEDVEDLAGNVIDKVQLPVAVVDTTRPTVEEGYYYSEKEIVKIVFSEAMNADDVLNLGNYYYEADDQYLNHKDYKVTITRTDSGKAVLIDFSKNGESFAGGKISVGKVRDLAGNYTQMLSNPVTIGTAEFINISSIKATAKNTIVVKLNDTLGKFVKTDFHIFAVKYDEAGNMVEEIGEITPNYTSFANVDGKGVITYTLKDADKLLTTGLTTPDNATIEIRTNALESDIKSYNTLGAKVQPDILTHAAIKDFDDIAPEIASAAFTDTDTLLVTFTEPVKLDTLSRTSFTVSGASVDSISYGTITNGRVTEFTLNLDKDIRTGNKVKITQSSTKIEDAYGNGATGLSKSDIKQTY